MTTVLLVDGTNIVMRCAFANAAGKPVIGVDPRYAARQAFGTVRNAARDWRAHYTIVALDVGGETWRKQLYPPYKANRSEHVSTLPFSLALAEACERERVTCVGTPGFEADDVVAAYVARIRASAAPHAYVVRILSFDSDLWQLVGDGVAVIHSNDRTLYTVGSCVARFGIQPSQLPLYKALVGERGDNLPGVPQLGPKRTVALCQRYATLAAMLDAGSVKGGTLHEHRVYEHAEQVRLVERLATLRADTPIPTLGSSARTPQPEQYV